MQVNLTRVRAVYRLYRRKLKSTANYLKKNKPAFYWSIIGIMSMGAVVFSFVVGLFFLVWFGALGDVPSFAEVQNIENHEASVALDVKGDILGKYYRENRLNSDFEELDDDIINALVDTEDARFFEHSGIDYRSWARVAVKSILMGKESSGGGSTITQQLAKNIYPRKRHRFAGILINKFREFIVAKRLEKAYSKEDILKLYLNTVPFSENTFGIKVAARRFFDKTPTELTTEEAAALIGTLKATSFYNPNKYVDRVTKRRNVVLYQMFRAGHLTEVEKDSLSAIELAINYTEEGHDEGTATHFRELVRAEATLLLDGILKPDDTPYDIYKDGLQIHTTIDGGMQAYAEDAVAWHMTRLQAQFDKHWNGAIPWYKNGVEKAAMLSMPRYQRLKAEGKSHKEILVQFNKKKPTEYFDWEGRKEVNASVRDSIQYYNALLNAGFVVMDTEGAVKAWVGGISYKDFQYDMVRSKRQVGSTFKPIIYANALQNGYTPSELIPNQLTIYTEYDDWQPQNADNEYGGFYSLLGGIVGSVNTIAVHLIMNTGIESAVDLATNMGITSDIPAVPSIALGTPNLSLLEMTGMYQTLANKGSHIPPSFISKITDQDGNIIIEVKREAPYEPALSDTISQVMTEMMQAVVDQGTGRRLASQFGLDNDIAGKTGTTQSHADGWFIGYTPTLVGGVRVGASSPEVHFRSLSLGQGSNMALPIFGKFMTSLKKDKRYQHLLEESFETPYDTVQLLLDSPLYLTDDEYVAMQEENRLAELIERIFGNRKREDPILEERSKDERQKAIDALIRDIQRPRKSQSTSKESAKIKKKNERLKKKRERQKKRKAAWKKIFG